MRSKAVEEAMASVERKNHAVRKMACIQLAMGLEEEPSHTRLERHDG